MADLLDWMKDEVESARKALRAFDELPGQDIEESAVSDRLSSDDTAFASED